MERYSNYPNTPERSEVMVLDPMSMELTVWKDFETTVAALHGLFVVVITGFAILQIRSG